MFTSYLEYVRYFQLVAAQTPGVERFSIYESDRLHARARAEGSYPILELERPQQQVSLVEGGQTGRNYNVRLSILKEVAKDDWHQADVVLSEMEAIISQVLGRMYYDEVIEAQRVNLVPITGYEHDNLFGWGIEFEVFVPESFGCEQPATRQAAVMVPTWTEGETLVTVKVNDRTYSYPWTDSGHEPPTARLAEAIRQDAQNPTATAEAAEGALVVRTRETGTDLDVLSEAGHDWTITTE